MDPAQPHELYLILQGVHRSVAARDAGLPGILAQVEVDGKRVGLRVIATDQLVSRKSMIGRWDRARDLLELVARMKTVEGRSGLAPIIVEPVSPVRAARYTHLADVEVQDHLNEDTP